MERSPAMPTRARSCQAASAASGSVANRSHARPGHAAVHNRLYWEGETTLGLGPAAASYVRDRMTNLRVGMFLEIATTAGAVCGALISSMLDDMVLFIIFGLVLLFSVMIAIRMARALNKPKDPYLD